MAIDDIRKINVRSPYYITVEDEFEPDVPIPPDPEPPTEPVVNVLDLACGDSINYAAAVGVKKIRISTANRQYGDYTVTFSNITIPIKYRIYNEGTATGAYTTKGLSQYADEWLQETGEVLSGTAGTTPISATLTHTTNSGNNNGEDLILEILAPMPISGTIVEITSCASEVVAPTPSTSGYVTVITIYNKQTLLKTVSGGIYGNATNTSAITIKLNGVSIALPSSPNRYGGVRIVCSDVTPNWIVDPTTLPYIANRVDSTSQPVFANWIYSASGSDGQMAIVYVSDSSLNSSINNLEITTQADHYGKYGVLVASHPTSQSGSENKILTHNNSEHVVGMIDTIVHQHGTSTLGNGDLYNRSTISIDNINEQIASVTSHIWEHPEFLLGEWRQDPTGGDPYPFNTGLKTGI